MAKQKLFYFQAYDQRQQWQKGSLVAQSKQAAQFQLIAKGFSQIRLQQDWQLNQKPKNAEISALLNQLATLLSSAIQKCITYFTRQLHTIGFASVAWGLN